MGREIRVALILSAAACLAAVLVGWAVEELNGGSPQPDTEAQQASAEVPRADEATQATVEAAPDDTERAQDATAESHDQG
jgi:hypothetical protein